MVLKKDDQLPNSPQDNHSLANLIKDLNINTGYTTRKITMEENIDKISGIVWLHVYVHTHAYREKVLFQRGFFDPLMSVGVS